MGTGVIEDAEEHVIALSVFRQSINLSQQVGQFLLGEIAKQRTECLLRGNGQDRTTRGGQCGFSPGNVSKESLHGRKRELRVRTVLPRLASRSERKSKTRGGGEVLDNELIDGASTARRGKLQQQLHGIPIRGGRVRAHAPLFGEIAKKERREQYGSVGRFIRRFPPLMR